MAEHHGEPGVVVSASHDQWRGGMAEPDHEGVALKGSDLVDVVRGDEADARRVATGHRRDAPVVYRALGGEPYVRGAQTLTVRTGGCSPTTMGGKMDEAQVERTAVRYKVVEVNQRKMFGRRMSARDLETAINETAADGWMLDRIVDTDTVGFTTGKKDAFLLIFRQPSGP